MVPELMPELEALKAWACVIAAPVSMRPSEQSQKLMAESESVFTPVTPVEICLFAHVTFYETS